MDSAAQRWIVAVVAASVLIAGLLLVPWSRGEPVPSVGEVAAVVAPVVAPKAAEALTEIVTREESTNSERVEPAAAPAAPNVEHASAAGQLKVRVLFDTREPASGASVRIGAGEVKVEPDGCFVVQRDRVGPADDLVATLEGYEPAVIDDLAQSEDFRSERVLEVILPGRASTIDGWLVEADGAPCQGWRLELSRGTDCGVVSFPNLLAEDLAAGARVQDMGARDPRSGREQAANPNLQTIGADGSFRIAGLRRGRDYVLRAWNEHTLRTAFSEPIPAGASRYVFTVAAADLRERVWGRVVDRSDAPIADVQVRLSMRVHEVAGQTSFQTGAQVRTQADGSFEFKDVPRQNLLLRFDGRDIDSYYHELLAADPGADLRIRLACLCRFRYEALPGAAAAASLSVLDANDKPLKIIRQIGQGSSEKRTSFAIENGRSPDLMVTDAAVWLVLLSGDGSQRRVAMRLSRADMTVLRD